MNRRNGIKISNWNLCRIDKLVMLAKKLKVGGGFEKDTDVGPLISKEVIYCCSLLVFCRL